MTTVRQVFEFVKNHHVTIMDMEVVDALSIIEVLSACVNAIPVLPTAPAVPRRTRKDKGMPKKKVVSSEVING
jgi:formyltetrahydrofolate synthetase